MKLRSLLALTLAAAALGTGGGAWAQTYKSEYKMSLVLGLSLIHI